MPEERVIELSKVKIILLTLGAVAFVLLGAWFLSLDTQTIKSQRKFNSPTLVYGVGIVSIAFFGLCGLIAVKKLFDNSPGLIINSEGILDNSSGVSAGIIPWGEIVGIGEYQVHKQKFISIQVKDPEKYVNNGSALKRIANRADIKLCGTPINISANSLKISHDDLLQTIGEYYRKTRENA